MPWDDKAAKAVFDRNGQPGLPFAITPARKPVVDAIPGARPVATPAVLQPGQWFLWVVDGDPIAKGRPRSVERKGQKARMVTPKRTEKAEKAFAEASIAAGCPRINGPVELEAVFYCATKRRVDTDNLLKLVTDALNPKWKRDKVTKQRMLSRPGIAYEDDVQIIDLIGRKRESKSMPRTVVRIRAAVPTPEVDLYEARAIQGVRAPSEAILELPPPEQET